LLYCIDTNFQYIILGFLEPAELAVVWNFKVFATAILLRVILGRRYTLAQWMALSVLVLGCAMTQATDIRFVHGLPRSDGVAAVWHMIFAADGGNGGRSFNSSIAAPENSTGGFSSLVSGVESPDSVSPRQASGKLVGTGLAMVGSTVAASSNVFCEWLFKQRPDESVYFQSIQLYIFGVAMNGAALVLKVSSDQNSPVRHEGGFFAGYSIWVWAVILIGAASGLVISLALKFMDNIAIVFSHALAVLIASGFSATLLGINFSHSFAMGGLLVVMALVAFHMGGSAAPGASDSKIPAPTVLRSPPPMKAATRPPSRRRQVSVLASADDTVREAN
jgi:UDP-sugar transporter A1/2/3